MTLTEFLLARIAEDEDAARTAGAWLCEPDAHGEDTLWENAEGPFPQPLLRRSNVEHHFDHIARHDPARVLRECEAKRLVVDRYAQSLSDAVDDDWDAGKRAAYGRVAHILATAYAAHPDYQPEWAL